MTKLQCCFCGQELKYDAWNEVYMCRNPNCKHLLGFGTKELWATLIRTHKELAVAVDALDRILNHATAIDTARCRAEMALKEITELEQKDAK